MDFRLLNGAPKATVIQRFNGEVVVIPPTKAKSKHMPDFGKDLHAAREYILKQGWEINLAHVHGVRRQPD